MSRLEEAAQDALGPQRPDPPARFDRGDDARAERRAGGDPGAPCGLERFEPGRTFADPRRAWAIVALGLVLYALGYAAFPPSGATVDDEDLYLEQTMLWIETGSFAVDKLDPLTDLREPFVPGDYPVGTVVLMAPFAKALGPNGAFLASCLSLLLAIGVTARWLADERRSPLFALILLAFPAAAVAGRLAMSDAARTAAAALGLWIFFRGLDGRRTWWIASGFVAGAALSLRETGVLPFVPLFAGSVLRRDRGWGWLLLGGLLGTALHLAASQLAFGSAFFVRGRASLYPLDLATIHERLPLYLFGLLVLVPGGLWFGLSYRGRRRPEIVATVALFFLFFLGQAYGMTASSFPKRLVVGLRYFDPLLPVLAFAMAEALPRQLGRLLARMPERAQAERRAGATAGLWVASALVAGFAVHPTLGRWQAGQDAIRAAIAHQVPRDAVLVTNGTAIRKFIDDLARPYRTLWRDDVSASDLAALEARHGGYLIAFLDRNDSAYWKRDAASNHAFVSRIEGAVRVLDLHVSPTDRLRIWRVGEPRRAAAR